MYIHSTLFWSKVVLVASDDAYVQDRHSRHLFKIIYLCERASIIYVNMRQSFLPLAFFTTILIRSIYHLDLSDK